MIRRSDQKPVVMWLLPLYSLCYYVSLVTSFGWMKAHAIVYYYLLPKMQLLAELIALHTLFLC